MYRTTTRRHICKGHTRFVWRGRWNPHYRGWLIIERTWAFLARAS
jgi:hypothetical protein